MEMKMKYHMKRIRYSTELEDFEEKLAGTLGVVFRRRLGNLCVRAPRDTHSSTSRATFAHEISVSLPTTSFAFFDHPSIFL